MKKDIKAAATQGASVFDTIATGATQEVFKVQEVQTVQSTQERQEALKTQGKKGAKAQRINMAFTPSNMDYMRVLSKIKGQTLTQFVNELIAKEREANADAYEKAKFIIENIK